MSSPRLFACVDRDSELVLLEVYAGRDMDQCFTNAVTDIQLAQGARLSHCRFQAELANSLHLSTVRVRQAEDSRSEMIQISPGGGVSRQDLHISLEGDGAECRADGLVLARDRQRVENHSVIEHVVGNTHSDQLYKSMLDDEAHAVFAGKICIHSHAQKSVAHQLSRNLVLSRGAQVDTNPELEIAADDVKATHGATVGQMDPEHLFYLKSRGLPAETAKSLLAFGFVKEVVYRMKTPVLQSLVGHLVDQELQSLSKSSRVEA